MNALSILTVLRTRCATNEFASILVEARFADREPLARWISELPSAFANLASRAIHWLPAQRLDADRMMNVAGTRCATSSQDNTKGRNVNTCVVLANVIEMPDARLTTIGKPAPASRPRLATGLSLVTIVSPLVR